MEKKFIPPKKQNLSNWYHKVILESELADYGPAKGTMIFRPDSYAIWELIQNELDNQIKAAGVDNVYFPLFIPESLIKKEALHIKGFSPELAVVTIGGGEKLDQKLVIRPTSETIIYHSFARWINSWRDLPIKINQWCNIVRWEKRTYLFLRTSEFLWQEGHTAHASHAEALEVVNWAIKMYEKMYQNYLALPGYSGSKSDLEKFAGADLTQTYEILMPDGKALQGATSHDLGQNFAQTFTICYQDKKGNRQYVWQTSWGLSTRSIGALIMVHGDDNGLRLPPKVAPVQVIIVPVRLESKLLSYAEELMKKLQKIGIRVKIDKNDDQSFGFKINKWELKGVPLRIEIGPKELEAKNWVVVRRDNFQKSTFKSPRALIDLLAEIQTNMLNQAADFLAANTFEADNLAQFSKIMNSSRGFIRANWCEDVNCELKIKQQTKATSRAKIDQAISPKIFLFLYL